MPVSGVSSPSDPFGAPSVSRLGPHTADADSHPESDAREGSHARGRVPAKPLPPDAQRAPDADGGNPVGTLIDVRA